MSCRQRRGAAFFASPGRWLNISCHDKLSWRYQVPVSGREVLCHDETVQMASKKQGINASADSPIDFVSAAGSVRVPQNFIS
jgi:hypothetical protein